MDTTSASVDLNLSLPDLDYGKELLNFKNTLLQNSIFNSKVLDDVKTNVEQSKVTSDLDEALKRLKCLEEKDAMSWKLKEENQNNEHNLKAYSEQTQEKKSEVISISNQIEEKKSMISSKSTELDGMKDRYTSEEDRIEKARSLIEADLAKWRRVLSLDLVTTTRPSLVFVFTNISQEDSQAKFKCELSREGGRFKVLSCEPSIKEQQELLERRLNESQDMAGFVFSLREAFKRGVK